MSDHDAERPMEPGAPPPGPKPSPWPRRIGIWVIGFFVSLAIGWAIEHVTDRDFLEGAEQAQAGWISAVSQTSPIAVASTFFDELNVAMTGHRTASNPYTFDPGTGGQGIASPIYALVMTVLRFFGEGGISTLVQLALGALAIAVFNFHRTKGEGIFFDEFPVNLFVGPILIVVIGSTIGLILQVAMLGALYALSWITGLAAYAAGATGVVGFCYYCVTELTKKGVEHVATPKIH